MKYILILVSAMAISLSLTPIMSRLAPVLGMLDIPNARKVHSDVTPRVGGIGIISGALIAILIWNPTSFLVLSYALGAVVLGTFGAWDDRNSLKPTVKLVGQVLAVIPIVVVGGIYVTRLPLISDVALPVYLAVPFTVFALVGMINALNTSDGLDGLAGGEAVISFLAIGTVAYLGEDKLTAVIAVAAIGGVLGFLRYNTYPATVFMGDSGSQFLGYALGLAVIILTQSNDSRVPPATVLLLLGLPLMDFVVVLIRRFMRHDSLFRAQKDHLHHRLLSLGMSHKAAVVAVYFGHVVLVTAGVLTIESDEVSTLLIYLAVGSAIYGLLYLFEHEKGKLSTALAHVTDFQLGKTTGIPGILVWGPRRFLEIVVPTILVLGALTVREVPKDFGMMSTVLLGLLVVPYLLKQTRSLLRRGLTYAVVILIVYLHTTFHHSYEAGMRLVEMSLFGLIALSIALALRFSPGRREQEFRPNAMDYLLVFVVFVAVLVTDVTGADYWQNAFVVYLAILFYACELIIVERRQRRWVGLGTGTILAAGILGVRGLLL
jgi:UDP-GlcNAc:undecaprenyl-phosphate GlcNAc-1-phosphate transferase